MALTKEQDDAILAAYLGIGILEIMCRKANLDMAEKRSKELAAELSEAFPDLGLAARAALRPMTPKKLHPLMSSQLPVLDTYGNQVMVDKDGVPYFKTVNGEYWPQDSK